MSDANDANVVKTEKGLFGTPKGFPTVFVTEFFERFSYYGMKAILLYYIIGNVIDANPGLGLDRATGISIVALYGALIYMSGIVGGWLSDRVLSSAALVTIGGFLIMCGHIVLALPFGATGMFVALALIILGTGGLKPNVSTMVGRLYDNPAYSKGRDAGFSIFYMGVNLGAFLATFIVGSVGQKLGYHFGFSLAAIGMGVGLFIFIVFFHRRFSKNHPNLTQIPNPLTDPEKKRILVLLGIAIIVIAAIFYIASQDKTLNIMDFAKDFITVAAIAIILYYFVRILVSKHITKKERNQVIVYIPMFIAGVLLWMIQEAGGTILAELVIHADNTILGFNVPESWYQSINPFIVISGAIFFAFLWTRMGEKQPSIIGKVVIGLILLGISYLIILPLVGDGKEGFSPVLIIVSFVVTAIGEVIISPLLLSATTVLAPRKFLSQLMAVWFLANTLAQTLNAQMASWYINDPQSYFTIIGLLPIVFALILFIARKRIMNFLEAAA
jgi:POT family proton-dependent oligopeptide transporter